MAAIAHSAVASQLNGAMDVTQIYSTKSAFAALRADGSVVTWGDAIYGGDSSAVASQLNGAVDVTQIYSTEYAFAALRTDGSVITWGNATYGGDSSAVASQLNSGVVSFANIYTDDFYIADPVWQITPGAPVVSEATADTIEFTVTRPADRLGIEDRVYVSTTQNHGSVNTSDYTGLLNIPYTFAVGEASKTVVVDILSDGIAEADETFGLIVQTNATDPISISLTSTTFTISENALPPTNQPPTAQPVSSAKNLQPGQSIALSELFTWNDPNGISDVVSFAVRDRGVGGGYLTENGVRRQDDQLFDNVPIAEIANWAFVAGEVGSADDVAFNAIDTETQYSTPSAMSTVTATSPASTDVWQINPIVGTVSEADGVIEFIVTRPDDRLGVEETVFFHTTGLNGSVNNSDFVGPNPSYTFGVGEKTSLPISVDILPDIIYDPNEMFDLIVKTSSNALLTSTNFTIQDVPFNLYRV